tara:strand:+ start:1235 stop:1585 length:351 start_codon:yes stop_codon:yes gene_type:complete
MKERAAQFTRDEAIRELGVPSCLIVWVVDYCNRAEQSGYARGYADGQASNQKLLTGHSQIAKYLGVSTRQSERIVKAMRDCKLLPPLRRGKRVVVKKQILDDFFEIFDNLADYGGS